MKQGYTQIYTGDGKGKTTASIGLSIRAAGAGLKVYICQFLKMGKYSEFKALERFSDMIKTEQFGTGKFIMGKPGSQDIKSAQQGFQKAKTNIASGEYDVVILEEANTAVSLDLIAEQDLLDSIDSKPVSVELVITGRGASQKLIEKADLVTEMKEIKHYYNKGVQARVGIEK